MADQKPVVIFNPSSGKKKDDPDVHAFVERLEADDRLHLHRLGNPSEMKAAVRRAVDAGAPCVIAAGGDGTICGVTSHLVDTGVHLGVLPMGTFNFVARGLDLPEDLDDALEIALGDSDRPLMIGMVNDRVFLNNASLGAYASVLDVREGVYKRWGRSRLAAYWSVIKAMLTLYHPLRMKITVDGESWTARSPLAFIASSAYQLDQYEFEGADAVRQGQLALLLAPDNNRLQLIWRAAKTLFGLIHRGEDYKLHLGRDIQIETWRGNRLVARDGERERMEGPYRFIVRTDAIRVRAPASTERTA